MPGRLFVVAGPSGVGKTTLEKRLLAELPGLAYSVSVTTRSPRPGEVHGRDYFFVSAEEFERLHQAGDLLESAAFFANRYGTPAGFVRRILAAGRDLLVDVEVEGVAQLRAREFDQAVFVLILPPSLAALAERLRRRHTESGPALAERLQRAAYELSRHLELLRRHNPGLAGGRDYLIVNDDLETAFQELKAIVLASRAEAANRLDILARLVEPGP